MVEQGASLKGESTHNTRSDLESIIFYQCLRLQTE
jgi:hypothetical protein